MSLNGFGVAISKLEIPKYFDRLGGFLDELSKTKVSREDEDD